MRNIKRVIAAMLIGVLVLMLTGCSLLPGRNGDASADGQEGQGVPTKVDNTGDQPQLGVPEDQLSFGLTKPEAPAFQEDVPGSADSFGSTSVGATTMQPIGDMHTEIDGYAYRLDPATMTPVGDPLDVITHEPVVLNDATSGDNESGKADSSGEEMSPSQEIPTDATKYPNTGIFLEDD